MAAISPSMRQIIASHSKLIPWYSQGKWDGKQLRALRAKKGVGSVRRIKKLDELPIKELTKRLAKSMVPKHSEGNGKPKASLVPAVPYRSKTTKFWFF